METVGESGQPTMVWRSGELAVVRVAVRFREAVADPVVGIMIRTRIGLNVYGTNTELEQLKLGPCAAGNTLELAFAFRCELCPEEYTLTVASHDPDGVWHDWLEDARRVHRQRLALHRRRGEPARPGGSAGAELGARKRARQAEPPAQPRQTHDQSWWRRRFRLCVGIISRL